MSMMALLRAPQVEVLGITIVTGNAWRDAEVQHTLRMLELLGRSDVPVVPGAVFPLVRTQEETRVAAQIFGKPFWSHGPSYGHTLTWPARLKPATGVPLVRAQLDVDLPRFTKMFVELMSAR
jgi:inosine-uridine nucleoside N-ribohydrolase